MATDASACILMQLPRRRGRTVARAEVSTASIFEGSIAETRKDRRCSVGSTYLTGARRFFDFETRRRGCWARRSPTVASCAIRIGNRGAGLASSPNSGVGALARHPGRSEARDFEPKLGAPPAAPLNLQKRLNPLSRSLGDQNALVSPSAFVNFLPAPTLTSFPPAPTQNPSLVA
jgi:hypothetical protein